MQKKEFQPASSSIAVPPAGVPATIIILAMPIIHCTGDGDDDEDDENVNGDNGNGENGNLRIW